MVEDVGLGGDDRLQRARLAQEIRRQNLDRRRWLAARIAAMTSREMPCPAVGEIVAIDRGDDDMGEPELGDGLGDAGGLVAGRARAAGRS